MEFLRSKAVTSLLIVVTIFFAALTIKTFKEYKYVGGGVPVTNTISVSGTGEVFAVPDIAQFSFSVEAERDTMEAAQKASAEAINDIIKYLENADVAEKDIKTNGYNAYPRYEWRDEPIEIDGGVEYLVRPGNNTRVLVGYVVTQSISVKVRDTEDAGEVLAGVSNLGATNVSGLNFTIDDTEALESEAREMAIDDARGKAKELARQLGVDLVRVVNFSEGGRGYEPMFYAERSAVAFDGAEEDFIAPEIPVGENEIRSNVTVTYEIR